MGRKSQRQSLITFRVDNPAPHAAANRNTKQIQNYAANRDVMDKSVARPGTPRHIMFPKGTKNGIVQIPETGGWRPDIPED